MKVLLLNGSPRKEGCTYTALTEVAETLKKNGVETEIFQAGDPSRENLAAAAALAGILLTGCSTEADETTAATTAAVAETTTAAVG